MKNFDYDITEWSLVSNIPASAESRPGVYQVALLKNTDAISKETIHPKIVYTGVSSDVYSRTYQIRRPKGNHPARIMRSSKNIPTNELAIRYIFINDGNKTNHTALERLIHKNTKELYGLPFSWKAASSGKTRHVMKVIDLFNSMCIEDLTECLQAGKEIGHQKVIQAFNESIS